MYENDLDMYGVPYPDGDPLTGLIVTIVIIIIYYAIIWIKLKLNKEK